MDTPEIRYPEGDRQRQRQVDLNALFGADVLHNLIPAGDHAGYIFDCDGTLADSMPLHFRAWSHAYETHGASFAFTWELFYSMAGTGLHDTVQILNQRYGESLDPVAVVDTQMARVEEQHHTLKPIRPVVGLARMLAQTHPIAVASGGVREHVHRSLEIVGIADLFSVVVTQEDVANSKPAPDSFLLAAERMGVNPPECIVFEDSSLGLEAAERAGMRAVYIDPEIYSSRDG